KMITLPYPLELLNVVSAGRLAGPRNLCAFEGFDIGPLIDPAEDLLLLFLRDGGERVSEQSRVLVPGPGFIEEVLICDARDDKVRNDAAETSQNVQRDSMKHSPGACFEASN